jgi:hypothetical protein
MDSRRLGSTVGRPDRDDFHLAGGVVNPPDDGMGTVDGNQPIAPVRATNREVSLSGNVAAEGFKP